MANPKQLTHRRSKLRWRLSYLTLALLGLWSVGAMAASVIATNDKVLDGLRRVLSSQISVVALIRQGWLGGLSFLLFAMGLTIWQIYRVGARQERETPPRRSPARAPTKSTGRNPARGASRSRPTRSHA